MHPAACGLAVLLTLACAATPGFTGDAAAGRRSAGDTAPIDLGLRLLDPRRALPAKEPLEAEIGKAREALFAGPTEPGLAGRIGPGLAELLADKDLHLLRERLARPADADDLLGRARAEAGRFFEGGELDGGVARSARPSFEHWVTAVRRSLGRPQPGPATAPTQAAVAAALQANAAAYQRYTLRRDQHELQRFEFRHAVERARRSPNGLPLVEQRVMVFEPVRDTRHALLRANQALRKLAARLAAGGAKVLRCRYGPADLWPDGTPRHEEQSHWLGRPPPSIVRLIAADTGGALGTLRTDKAWAACPGTDRGAEPPAPANARALP